MRQGMLQGISTQKGAILFRRSLILSAAAAASVAFVPSGRAATLASSFNLSANVVASASATVSQHVSFGTVLVSGMTGVTGSVTITSTAGTSLTVALDQGQNPSGSQRRMVSNGQYMNYNLYQPNATGTAQASPAVPWGDGTSLGASYTATGTGSAQTFNVYAEIPSGQNLYAGTYTDTITLTLSY